MTETITPPERFYGSKRLEIDQVETLRYEDLNAVIFLEFENQNGKPELRFYLDGFRREFEQPGHLGYIEAGKSIIIGALKNLDEKGADLEIFQTPIIEIKVQADSRFQSN